MNQSEKLFSDAFENNTWGDPESRSGPGSTEAYTRRLRKFLPALLKTLDVQSILDAPCGDFNWMRLVDLDGISYLGGDIVSKLIVDNRRKYPGQKFRHLDITRDRLPNSDFWLCRDVLFHLSNEDIFHVLFNFLASNIKWFCTSHFLDCSANWDAPSDPRVYRPINLCLAPFSLPPPDYCLKDSVPGRPQRWLAVWDREALIHWFNLHIRIAQVGLLRIRPNTGSPGEAR
jgi:hypothetical protein